MIPPLRFLEVLKEQEIEFFSGVPDSLMKDFIFAVSNTCNSANHIVASNEGSAIGHAIGYFLGNGKIAAVYMQNSGIGNAYNPIISLADHAVYGIPMVLIIGWRGELDGSGAQVADEPQHKKQGQITLNTLNAMGVPYRIVDTNSCNWQGPIVDIIKVAKDRTCPVAIVFKKNSFTKFEKPSERPNQGTMMSREQAIESIVKSSSEKDIFIASTGMISRELFEIRAKNNMPHKTDFLTVGGMGHSSQIAVSVAKLVPDERVVCLDGDGSLLMHCGGMAECANTPNLIHVVLNNGAHDSVGGQPTKGFDVNFQKIAEGFGYDKVAEASADETIKRAITDVGHGSRFLEVKCSMGNRKDLGRPTTPPKQNMDDFMSFIQGLRYD